MALLKYFVVGYAIGVVSGWVAFNVAEWVVWMSLAVGGNFMGGR